MGGRPAAGLCNDLRSNARNISRVKIRQRNHKRRAEIDACTLDLIAAGVLAVAYGIWTANELLKADAGSPRMQEIAAAIAEGAQAYLKRQYSTIAIVGIVIFVVLGFLLSWTVAIGFLIARSSPALPASSA